MKIKVCDNCGKRNPPVVKGRRVVGDKFSNGKTMELRLDSLDADFIKVLLQTDAE